VKQTISDDNRWNITKVIETLIFLRLTTAPSEYAADTQGGEVGVKKNLELDILRKLYYLRKGD